MLGACELHRFNRNYPPPAPNLIPFGILTRGPFNYAAIYLLITDAPLSGILTWARFIMLQFTENTHTCLTVQPPPPPFQTRGLTTKKWDHAASSFSTLRKYTYMSHTSAAVANS